MLSASTRKALTAPRSAAVAGIIFAVLLGTSLVLLRLSVPSDLADLDVARLDTTHRRRILVALTLIPYAGIAFLWFVGVVRDRIGEAEDRFIATVFLGSGLLFLAMLFVSTAVAGALVISTGTAQATPDAQVWALGAHVSSTILNVYAMRMAGVFMISTATISLTDRGDASVARLPRVRARGEPAGRRRIPEHGRSCCSRPGFSLVSAYLLVAAHRADRSTALR